MTVLVSLLVVLTAELNLQHLNVKITSRLKLSGDIELNQGLYQIIRSVQGSFNQGIALFGETAGRQCACNALFSICWSVVRDICNWKSIDLDYILFEGYKLYKLLKCHDYLNVDQLPRQVKIFERTVNLDILEENLHDSIAVYGDSFLTDVFTVSNGNTTSGCILFLCSYAVALFRYVNGRGNVTYFLFDCRNNRGNILCDELSHPHLFPTGKFGFQTKRKVYLTSRKYLNQSLLNYTQKFSFDSDYIFFPHSAMQKLNLSNQIHIAMRKVTSSQLTAGMLSSNFNEKVKEFIVSNQAFTFMNSI